MKDDTQMSRKYILLPTIGLVIAAISFVGGMETQKLTAKTATTAMTGQNGMRGEGGYGGRYGGARPTFGTVSSITGSTMVIQDSQSGTATTVTLTGSTVYTASDGTTASESQVATGDTVAVSGTTTNGTLTATRVRINPTMGSGAGGTMTPDDAQSGSNGST